MYKRQKKSWVKHLDFLLLDMICFGVAFFISYLVKISGEPEAYVNIRASYSRLVLFLLLVDICIAFFSEPYTGILRRTRWDELKAAITHCTIVFVVLIIYVWLTKQSEIFSRQILLVFWGLSLVFVYFSRCVWKIILRQRMIHGEKFVKFVIITENRYAESCVEDFQSNRYKEYEVTGVIIVDRDRTGERIGGVPVVASADGCLEYIRTHVVDEVLINGNTRESSEALAEELLELGVTVHFYLVHASSMRPNRMVNQYGQYIVLTSSMKIASNYQIFIKRTMDIVGSAIGLLFTGVAFLIFAPVIKIQSPGPVFYSQTRIGRNGRRFKFHKFRTMVVNADQMKDQLMEQNEMDGHMFKMKDDPRIFGIGKVMRKFSIDELPQFWNVLKGDMSLVGTRPPTEDEFEQYELHHKARLGIKPGLTGMWQVSGRSEIQDFEEVVGLDTYYISNWTLGLDLKILFKTIAVVLSGKGSE